MMESPVKVYESDLTQEQCWVIELIMLSPNPSKRGRPRAWIAPAIINAIMYVVGRSRYAAEKNKIVYNSYTCPILGNYNIRSIP